MTLVIPSASSAPAPSPSWRERRREVRRLRHADELGARLARLHAVDLLLASAHARLETGWVQGAWFVDPVEAGGRRHVSRLSAIEGIRSERACLVGAVAVEGLPGSLTDPEPQRALAAMWHAVHGSAQQPDRAVAPGVTIARAWDLIRWNDPAGRSQIEVLALVRASRTAVGRAADVLRVERSAS